MNSRFSFLAIEHSVPLPANGTNTKSLGREHVNNNARVNFSGFLVGCLYCVFIADSLLNRMTSLRFKKLSNGRRKSSYSRRKSSYSRRKSSYSRRKSSYSRRSIGKNSHNVFHCSFNGTLYPFSQFVTAPP